MNERTEVIEQPASKIAIPLFILTSLPYFGVLAYDYIIEGAIDKTFMWFGAFYLGIGLFYFLFKRSRN